TKRDRAFGNRAYRDDTFAGFRLTMNIFDGLRSSNESASLNIKSKAAETRLNHVIKTLNDQFEIIKEEMIHAHELTHVSEEKIKQGELYFKKTLREYDKGIKNSLDVLNSLQRIVSFKTEYAKIRLDYQNKKASLLKMKGI
ncbi:MAG: TolC family protein, partial [Halobacteriovoraceae bacterium]|nr:TolC family protein [Halobacteriovoraceae bacterium]